MFISPIFSLTTLKEDNELASFWIKIQKLTSAHRMNTAFLLLLNTLPFCHSAPDPDTHLHVHLPPEGGQGKERHLSRGKYVFLPGIGWTR